MLQNAAEEQTASGLRIPGVSESGKISTAWLREIALQAGAADARFVSAAHPDLAAQSEAMNALLPGTRSLISLAGLVHRPNTQSPLRSLYNLEQNYSSERLEQAARAVAASLEQHGVRAVYLPLAFPAEFETLLRVSHKTVAVASGMGQMGLNRLLLHPEFGSCIQLTTVLLDRELTVYDAPCAENPCFNCKLCAAVCPTGAICADGHFNPSACLTHNYRFRLGGFQDWVDSVIRARSPEEYRDAVPFSDTLNIWQGLTYGASNRCGYCVGVCPAGRAARGEYDADRKKYLEQIVKPLREKQETIYAVRGSDADGYAERHFPAKNTKRVGSGAYTDSAAVFFAQLPFAFQPGRATGIDTVCHFDLTGITPLQRTVTIRDRTLNIQPGLEGDADLRIHADAAHWMRLINRKSSMLLALLTRRLRVRGGIRLFKQFFACFPRS